MTSAETVISKAQIALAGSDKFTVPLISFEINKDIKLLINSD